MSQLGNTLGNRPLIPQLPRLISRCVDKTEKEPGRDASHVDIGENKYS
jgi:hypothetical protein